MATRDERLAKTSSAAIGAGRAGPRQESADAIYETVMRGGGEPFGAPFEAGLSSLTRRVVELLRQSGFFALDTVERLRRRNRRNKFTRHGAAPFVGEYEARRRHR